MAEKRHQLVARTISLLFKEDKILLIKGSKRKDWHGIHTLPGGHLEKGETILECAKREIIEETEIDPENIRVCGVINVANIYGKNVVLFVTVTETKQTGIKQSDEGTLHWKKFSELDNLRTFEDIKPIIKTVKSLKKGQMFYGVTEFDGKDKIISFKLEVE